MPYLGNEPATAYTSTTKDTFSGDASTTDFTMSKSANVNAVRVVVENVVQNPTVAYTCSGTTLSFTSAPPTGTNNIYVVHLGPPAATVAPPTTINNATTFTGGVTLKNETAEDTDGGRESIVTFQGTQSGNEITTLAQIQASHDGTSDDEKGDLIFKTNDGSDGASPTEAMRITSQQRVGIGDVDPIAPLHISSGDSGASASVHSDELFVEGSGNSGITIASGTSGYGNVRFADSGGTDQGIVQYNHTDDEMLLYAGAAARVRIKSDGATKLVADGVTPTSGGMHSAENSLANSYTFMVRDHVADPLSQYLVEFSYPSAAPNNTSAKFLQCRDSGGARLNIESNGDVKNANNTYGAISDEKLKENIVDSGSQWADIKAVKVRKYSFKADELDAANRIGVIAQELEASGMNGLVDTQKDLDLETREDLGTETKSVKYSVLYMKAIKALQEAMARIETLETKVAALEAE